MWEGQLQRDLAFGVLGLSTLVTVLIIQLVRMLIGSALKGVSLYVNYTLILLPKQSNKPCQDEETCRQGLARNPRPCGVSVGNLCVLGEAGRRGRYLEKTPFQKSVQTAATLSSSITVPSFGHLALGGSNASLIMVVATCLGLHYQCTRTTV